MSNQEESLIKDKHARNTFQEIEEETVVVAPTYEGLEEAIIKQPLNKPVYRKILIRLRDEASTEEMEEFISSLSEFKYAVQPEGRFLESLERAGGLERVGQVQDTSEETPSEDGGNLEPDLSDSNSGSRDKPIASSNDPSNSAVAGSPMADEISNDSDEVCEEVDDTITGVIWKTTGLGEEYLANTEPSDRLHTLFDKEPGRKAEYLYVMQLCEKSPKKLGEIVSELERREEERDTESVHPSVYLDRLEAAGMITWDEAWTLTEEGRECLAELL